MCEKCYRKVMRLFGSLKPSAITEAAAVQYDPRYRSTITYPKGDGTIGRFTSWDKPLSMSYWHELSFEAKLWLDERAKTAKKGRGLRYKRQRLNNVDADGEYTPDRSFDEESMAIMWDLGSEPMDGEPCMMANRSYVYHF